MAENLMPLFERIWQGEPGAQQELGQLATGAHLVEVAPDVAVVIARGLGVCSNVIVFRTTDGLAIVDTGGVRAARPIFEAIRAWDTSPLRVAIYTHGHGDHVFGVGPFDAEAQEQSRPAPRVLASDALPPRFDRYTETSGYNAFINSRQFGMPIWRRQQEFRYPDETYHDTHSFELGGERFELYHGRGETDDHTWVWLPEKRIVCTGDFFIWVFPNAGNPAKVQRYAHDWALALRQMAAKEPELLLPGHGAPIVGKDRVRTALNETADALDDLHTRTIALMNEGATLDEIIHSVHPAPEVLRR
ncbi:MAG: MBL fold metallo-hydrolase, partial [Dehalococcoidia bacterium]